MHIKQVIIQGFKTYKDQTVMEEFAPGHNVVVGRNGSGKSNFFAAIRFVLADAYATMGREERQALLHEGTGPATMSAYVEMVFDNSDGRFPTGRDEVVLRRTIGLKKDEYSLDRKSVPKSEVMSLLESAGFSRANPYYIVPQGRITSLCNAKDHERLQLLKEVAGTRVYEQRRQESLKIMTETDLKRGKIDELLTYIEERLAELEEEKEELRAYHDLDRDRRSMEYTIYQRELTDVTEQLETLENNRQAEISSTAQMRHQAHDRERMLAELEEELKAAKHTLQLQLSERKQTAEDMEEQTKVRAQIELLLRDQQDAQQSASANRRATEKELTTLDKELQTKEASLTMLTENFKKLSDSENSARQQLAVDQNRRDVLVAKRGRHGQFRNKKDRDDFLKKELRSVTVARDGENAQQQQLAEEVRQAAARLSEQESVVEKMRLQVAKIQQGDNTNHDEERVKQLKHQQTELNLRRKELWRQDAQLDAAIANYREEQRRAARALSGTMDRNTSTGLEAVKKIAERLGLTGVYGPLYELFEVDERYQTAVEVTAGNSLFHVVVDTDETVARILDVLSREKSGRVTFMPLNRLDPQPVDYPKAKDALPMVKKLQFDERYKRAFDQVFGKTVICPNLETASGYAKSHGLNAITLDGDKAERKGALTGGYHDARRSRLETIAALKQCTDKLDAEQLKSDTVKRDLAATENQLTKVHSDLQLVDATRRRQQSNHDLLAKELAGMSRELVVIRDSLSAAKKRQQSSQANLLSLSTQHDGIQAELNSPLTATLSDAEVRELDKLERDIVKAEAAFGKLTADRAAVEMELKKIEMELEMNLKRRREDLVSKLAQADSGEGVDPVADTPETSEEELKSIQVSLKALSKKSADLDKSIDDAKSRTRDLQTDMERIQAEQSRESRHLDDASKHAEQFLARRTILQQKKTECTDKIRGIGALPDDAFEKYLQTSSKRLVKDLHKVNESLKKYSHVNKKAYEQYNNFTKQRDSLQERKKELDASAKAIQELIQVLDQRKDEAIEASFKQVKQNFEEIFERLVPAGRGELIMQHRDPESQQENSMEVEGATAPTSERYSGIGIKVSFNSKTDEGLLMQQLSGGQKSLVALGMIFAVSVIQKCDPAPFYLFDEIDANLDAAYRTAVANMVHELSSEAQFITTTFRPELLRHADKFYGVTFRNRVSRIDVISKDDAVNFVEQAH